MMKKLIAILLVVVLSTSLIVFNAFALQKGDKGEAVKKLQKRLNKLGYYKITKLTGVYSDDEVEAVKSFQSNNGLEPTGIADDETLELLYDKKKAKRAPKKAESIPTDENMISDSDLRLVAEYFLKKILKNPDSLNIRNIYTIKNKDDYNVCVEYTGMNGFGGYSQEMIIMTINYNERKSAFIAYIDDFGYYTFGIRDGKVYCFRQELDGNWYPY